MKLKIAIGVLFICSALSCGSPKIVAMQPSDPVIPQMPSPPKDEAATRIAAGKGLFEERCSNCHKLYSPSDFSQTDWAPILKRMQPKAKFDDEQMDLVRQYIYSIAQP